MIKQLLDLAIATVCALVLLSAINNAHANEGAYLEEGSFVIIDVTVIDGTKNDPVDHQDIFIAEVKVVNISQSGTETFGDEVIRIDGSGLTVMPGLIDMHIHLKGGWHGGNAGEDPGDERRRIFVCLSRHMARHMPLCGAGRHRVDIVQRAIRCM